VIFTLVKIGEFDLKREAVLKKNLKSNYNNLTPLPLRFFPKVEINSPLKNNKRTKNLKQ
jgi:hypothetical protein